MKKNLLILFVFFCLSFSVRGQIQTIIPDSAIQGQTLITTISMAAGSFSLGSPPVMQSDIYLQQGATVIQQYSGYNYMNNVYWGTDSLWTQFTIPAIAPGGYYDLHVTTYDWQMNQTFWTLPNAFYVGYFAGIIEGDVYFDMNQNGVKDIGEQGIANHQVSLSPGGITLFTDNSGHYTAYCDTGTFTVDYLEPNQFSQTSLPLTYTVPVPPSNAGLDFGSYSSQALYDHYFYVWHHPMRCAPSYGFSYIQIENNGILSVQGKVTMVHSSNLPLNTSTIPPDVISGDTLIWNYTQLDPGQAFFTNLSFFDPAAGDTIWYTTVDSLFDMGGTFIEAYTDSFGFVVTCSCDPNDKHVSPYGIGAAHYTPPNTQLSYTINFQNTGNDTAITVVIMDSLDADLDWSTFEMISHTHPVSVQMDANGVLRFTFNNIMLPDSNVDEPGSHGAVAYQIMTDSLLPDPTEITNTAYIYFDWNPAVVTNTTLSTMTDLQFPSADFSTPDVSICPLSCVDYNSNPNPNSFYQWSFPGGMPSTSTDANPSNICYNTSGMYDAQLIVSNPLGADTVYYQNYVEVFTVAAQAIVQSGDSLIANQGFVTYTWYYNGNVIPGATDYFYVASQDGDYHMISIDANGCDVEAALFNVMLSANSLVRPVGITIHPNPAGEWIEITGVEATSISVYNVLGERVLLKEISGNEMTQLVSCSKLSPGSYTVEVAASGKIYRHPIIKQ